MNEIKKIKLNDEPKQTGNELQSQGGRLRLPPTGSGSGAVYTGGATTHAEATLCRGNYEWRISVSASITVSVTYRLEEGELVFKKATVTCTGASATFMGTVNFVGRIDPDGKKNGIEYSSISCYPSVTGQASEDIYDISPVSFPVCTVELQGFETTYIDGNPQEPGELQTFPAGVVLRVAFNCNPYSGVYQVGAEIDM